MQIAFVDFVAWDYDVHTPYRAPLGGSQSALCYLAEALAELGHSVVLLNNVRAAGVARGVHCLPRAHPQAERTLQTADAVVVQNVADVPLLVRQCMSPAAPLVLWTQHAHDQPAMQGLADPALRDAWDALALVSEWQRLEYVRKFAVDPARTCVLRNAIGPSFAELFADNGPILPHKTEPTVLAYTSTPFRGLDGLITLFPPLRRAFSGLTLKVFSGMGVYQGDAAEEAEFQGLYARCRSTEGVEYLGSIPQAELARQMKHVAVLAYPNTFAETSCIAVLEAMAAGCLVVTSDLAALPETLAGNGWLIPIRGQESSYLQRYLDQLARVLKWYGNSDTAALETHLQRQVRHVRQSFTWRAQAGNWVVWLQALIARRRRDG